MPRVEFKLPDVGEGIAEAEIVAWHVKPGDMVEEDQPLADLMTDKATIEMESPVAGRVIELAGVVGERLPIGSILAVFETAAETVWSSESRVAQAEATKERLTQPTVESSGQAQQVAAADKESSSATDAPASVPAAADNALEAKPRILASPAVRQRARQLGIELSQVKTAGERIRHADLDAYLLYHGGALSKDRRARRQDKQVAVVGLRRKIAENMAEAKRRIPHFTLVEEYDVTALEQTRGMMNSDRGSNPRLTMLPFLISALTQVLVDYPQFNATYDDEAQSVTRWGMVQMGVATQTPNGLMVPVIRNADRLGVWDLARELLRLAEAVRAGKAAREELSGSTITISSLGPLGGIASTPVINRPEVAILAVNKIEEKPVVVEGKIEVRKRMNLSLSCDHRVIDGWDAAMLMADLKALLERPLKLLSQAPNSLRA